MRGIQSALRSPKALKAEYKAKSRELAALSAPPFDDNGQPDPNRPSIHAAASAAEAAYWQAVATAARVEPSAMAWKSEVPGLWDAVRVFLPGKASEIVLMA